MLGVLAFVHRGGSRRPARGHAVRANRHYFGTINLFVALDRSHCPQRRGRISTHTSLRALLMLTFPLLASRFSPSSTHHHVISTQRKQHRRQFTLAHPASRRNFQVATKQRNQLRPLPHLRPLA